MYNPGKFCGLHEREHGYEVMDGYRECAMCGTILPLTPDNFQPYVSYLADGSPVTYLRHACRRCMGRRARTYPVKPATEAQRWCRSCGKTKPIEQFASMGKGRKRPDCKTCYAKTRRDQYRRRCGGDAVQRAQREMGA
jgi:hypothetical protein